MTQGWTPGEIAPGGAVKIGSVLRDSLPVMMGYVPMGFVAGMLLAAKGALELPVLWSALISGLWVTGTMSFAAVPEIAGRSPWTTFALITLAVNFRYALYGFSMLSRWKGVPWPRKLYLILLLTDENFALELAHQTAGDQREELSYCTWLSLLNHSYWIVGSVAGALLVVLAGKLVDPETIRAHVNGMEFAMVALFLVIFTDQMREMFGHGK